MGRLAAGDQRQQGGGVGLDPRALLEAEHDQGLPDEKPHRPLGLHEALPKDRVWPITISGDPRGLEVAEERGGAVNKPRRKILINFTYLVGCY